MEGQHKPLTTRRATRLVLKRPQQRTDGDTQLIAHLQAQHSDVAVGIELAQDFWGIVRERQADRFDRWLALAVASGAAPLRRFATGLARTMLRSKPASRCVGVPAPSRATSIP
jgi:transposase